jgi:chromosome segregation ATPase
MFYIQIAIAIAIYAAGYATAWKVEVREVARLEASIESANQQAQATLSAIQERVKSAQDKAEVVAVQLESEHTQSSQSIAHLSTRLAVARLQYAKHSAGRGCTLPKISDTPYDQIHDEAGSYLSADEL